MPAVTRLTREELYARIWAEPIDRLAPKFGISGVGLAKLCRRHQIPVPGRGYWARRAAGQRVIQTPLPVPANTTQANITIHRTGGAAAETDMDSEHQFITRESLPDFAVDVPATLPLKDPLVIQTADLLRKAKPEASGLVPVPENALHLRCSPEQRDRGLRIWQALASAFAKRDYRVTVEAKGTRVEVLDEPIGVALEEGTKTVPHVPTEAEQRQAMRGRQWTVPTHDTVPDGALTLTLTNVSSIRQRWTDGKTPIERHLNQFLKGLLRAALTIKAQRQEGERRAQALQEQERQRREAERRHRLEKFRSTQLDALLAGWDRAEALQRVLTAYREAVEPIEVGSDLESWLSQMEEWIAEMHPVRRLQPDETIRLVHVGHGAARFLKEGFSETTPPSWSGGDTPPGILLESHYSPGGDVLIVEILERLILPYEMITAGSDHRRFYVPAEILNRHAKATLKGTTDDE
jgi:hypothetical protein